jgi:hypothetical protein
MVNKFARFLTDLIKIIGVFFPAILLQLITVVVFIQLPQAYDLVTIYAEKDNQSFALYPAVLAWSFISWYTARLVYYAYLAKDKDNGKGEDKKEENRILEFTLDEINAMLKQSFKTETGRKICRYLPRLIGLSVFFIISLVIICHAYFPFEQKCWPVCIYIGIIVVVKLLLVLLVKKIQVAGPKKWWKYAPVVLAVSTLCITITAMFISRALHGSIKISLITTLILLACMHIVFTLYMSFRRMKIYANLSPSEPFLEKFTTDELKPGWLDRVLNFFSLPLYEKKLFIIFLVSTCLLLVSHFISTVYLPYIRYEGPFAFAMIAFALLTVLGNLLSFFNYRVKINLHVLVILWVIIIGFLPLNHYGVHITNATQDQPFNQRTQLNVALDHWIARNKTALETENTVPMFFVISDGGASRSAYWAAGMMGKLEDITHHEFSKRTFAISGASGGSVGNAVFYSLLCRYYIIESLARNHKAYYQTVDADFDTLAKSFLSNDFLSYPLSHYLGQDFITHILPFNLFDRADALEYSMKHPKDEGVIEKIFSKNLSELFCNPLVQQLLPVFYINTTRVQDSWPGVISSIRFDSIPATHRMDVLDSLDEWYNQSRCRKPCANPDMELVTAAIMSSRFPYLSPAGSIGKNCFVDGGYFDNSGAGMVHETILSLERLVKNDTTRYLRYFKKIKFYVVHFRNSPYTGSEHKMIHPLVNDLLAPILTLKSSFDGQTDINNERLKYYVENNSPFGGKESWIEFALNDSVEDEKARVSFSMSWVISSITLHAMDQKMVRPNIKTRVKKVMDLIK